jgi:hypothetical protein
MSARKKRPRNGAAPHVKPRPVDSQNRVVFLVRDKKRAPGTVEIWHDGASDLCLVTPEAAERSKTARCTPQERRR